MRETCLIMKMITIEHLNKDIKKTLKLEAPSKQYTKMMDGLLEKFYKNELVFSNINEVMTRNGIPNEKKIKTIKEVRSGKN